MEQDTGTSAGLTPGRRKEEPARTLAGTASINFTPGIKSGKTVSAVAPPEERSPGSGTAVGGGSRPGSRPSPAKVGRRCRSAGVPPALKERSRRRSRGEGKQAARPYRPADKTTRGSVSIQPRSARPQSPRLPREDTPFLAKM